MVNNRDSLGRFKKGVPLTKEQKDNIKWHAKNNPNFGMRGKKHSERSKKIMSNNSKTNPNFGMKGKKQSKKFKQMMSLVHKGKKISGETRLKISKSKKGQIPWIKGKKHSEKTREKLSKSHMGQEPWNKGLKCSEETKSKLSKINKGQTSNKIRKTYEEMYGKIKTEEIKRKISKACKGRKAWNEGMGGKGNPNWQGGKSFEPYNKSFNNRFKKLIRKRDNQICMLCGTHREKLKRALDIHHINYEKLLSIPQNCISLCRNCHSKTGNNRKHWITFFQDLLIERYNYKYNQRDIVIDIGEINN